jgi:hypothetical protein
LKTKGLSKGMEVFDIMPTYTGRCGDDPAWTFFGAGRPTFSVEKIQDVGQLHGLPLSVDRREIYRPTIG